MWDTHIPVNNSEYNHLIITCERTLDFGDFLQLDTKNIIHFAEQRTACIREKVSIKSRKF